MTRAVRICVVRAGYFPDDPRVRRAVGALLDAGYEVDVVALRGEDEPAEEQWRTARVHRLPVGHRREGLARYVWEYAAFLALASLKVARLHLRGRFEVVQIHTMPDALVFCAILPRLLGAKVLLDMHELMPEFAAMKFRFPGARLLVRLTTMVERRSARFADRVVGVSTAQASIIEPRVGRTLHIVPNVPDEALLTHAPRDGPATRPTLISHGTLTESYGVQLLLDALPRVLEETDVHTLVVGDGEFRRELERQAAVLGIAERVTFTGRVPPAALAGFIVSAWAGVITLRRDGYGELCVPNKLFDYAALGVPVVAPTLWAIETYFGPDGLVYFTPGDADDLARTLVRTLSDEPLREQVATRARAIYDSVRWEKSSRTYLGVVAELLDHGRA